MSEEMEMATRPKDTPRNRALKLVRRQGIARARDLKAAGIAAPYLQRLVLEGELEQPARGQYRIAGKAPSAGQTLAVAARAVPNGIVCLLSALRVHDLGTQTPHEVWMLIGAKAWAPVTSAAPLRIVRSRDLHERVGVESSTIEGVEVRLTSPERTVVECFKHRNTVGLDVALEALRELIKRRRGRTDELWRVAKVFRMQNVMRPYLEATA
jgi:predicted transcriptional regulator of viral defense system